jgi:methyl-accepting chemotaxis protein
LGHIEEIDKAIGAHGLWKARIKDAIKSGKSDFKPEVVQQNNQCDFGKWFYALEPAIRRQPVAVEVEALHTEFHKLASGLIKSATTGQKAAAEKGAAEGSPFFDTSMKLVTKMVAWKKVIDAK